MTDTMRAIVLDAPGPPGALTICEVPVPTPAPPVYSAPLSTRSAVITMPRGMSRARRSRRRVAGRGTLLVGAPGSLVGNLFDLSRGPP